ncbi:unnamed protein product [Cuscuta epithymum]|uniref:Receptor-like serine/threonine-protein kinase n=1 Tax=Cuscuta epithymum TaxID=186058 RepID=A0AAV0CN08_9ASTE|nr:unnamed protein product [Cuscuta epithymum]
MKTMHCITFLVSILTFQLCLSSSTHIITFNQTLKDGDLLTSSADSYALGFFTPGKSAGKRYVGIWYQNIPEFMAVWVANRDNPVNGTSGIFFIDGTGNLVIQDRNTGVTVWNTSLSFPAFQNPHNHSVQLLETGNLVLYRDPGRRVKAWESFDYPTNTVITSMKFGVDKKDRLNRSLTSWKSADDPGTGEYSLGMDLNGEPQAFVYKNSSRIWRLGSWTGTGWSNVPEMSGSYTPYNYTENGEEVTLSYTVVDPSIYTIFMLNESGTLNRIIWRGDDSGGQKKKWVGLWYIPKDTCDTYEPCGAFGVCNPYNLGESACHCLSGFKSNSSVQEWALKDDRHSCRREANTDACHNGDGFLKLTSVNIPNTETAFSDRAMGFKECEERCVKNCSCSGYARANISNGGEGCINWYGELRDMREFANGGRDVYIRVATSALAQRVKKSNGLRRKWLIIILATAIPAVAVILLLLYLTWKMRKGSPTATNLEEGAPADVVIFDLNTIKLITDNFSAESKLGEGGFGSVHKGKLQNGKLVAVKRLKTNSDQGVDEFKNEVMLIAKLQHRNLVRLLGCCVQEGEKMLVYEYLPNNSLDYIIFDNKSAMQLDWKKRFEIILGIAQGLLYLHQDSRLRIIHRDLKASNVLLDDSMEPKISDFGMARIFGEEQTEANTNQVVGTYGYMSPEYAMEGLFSIKSDVFSFGVLMLEIVCGKKNKYQHTENSVNLMGDVWDFWNEERALGLVDPSLGGESYNIREVSRCIHVGLLCVQPLPNDRPNISEVIFMLSNETELPSPNPPGFMVRKGYSTTPSSYGESVGYQSISMTVTQMEGR